LIDSIHCARRRQAPASHIEAYGSTLVLAPSCSFRMSSEEGTNFTAFLKFPGLALLVRSECQPTASARGAEAELTPMLSLDAQRMLLEDNAGGSSRVSEAMSFEVLHRAFGAQLLKLELELRYWPPNGSITDYSIDIDGVQLGVSVTRAMGKPGVRFGVDAAEALLRKKLGGVIRSSQTCLDDLEKQILHIWVQDAADAEAVERAYAVIEPELVSSTVVLVTVCGLQLLFHEKSRAPVPRCRVVKGIKDEVHLQVLRESDPLHCRARLVC